MMGMLHALSSTFTTCACGAKAKDCALTKMAEFVDGQMPPTPSPSPPSIVIGDEQHVETVDSERHKARKSAEGSSKRKENRVDFGPLVGVQRGFKTRERMPNSGGLYGVEMDQISSKSPDDIPQYSPDETAHIRRKDRKGKRKMVDEDGEINVPVTLHVRDSDDNVDGSAKGTPRHVYMIFNIYPISIWCRSSSSSSHVSLSFPGAFSIISDCDETFSTL